MMDEGDRTHSCIVVGAGLSGLAAATTLRRAGITDVVILEANSRIGGRVLTDRTINSVELGAAFFGPSQNRMLALIEKLKLKTVEAAQEGDSLLVTSQGTFRWSGDSALPNCSRWVSLDLNNTVRRIEALTELVDVAKPEKTPKARELDAERVPGFLRTLCWSTAGYHFLLSNFRALLTTEPSNVSVLQLLWFLKCGGGLNSLLNGETWKLKGGNTQIVNHLLEEAGGTEVLRLNTPVRKVCYSNADGTALVTLGTDNKEHPVLHARSVIFAVPPTQLSRVVFDPPLPVDRRLQLEAYTSGQVIKTFAFFSEPFWKRGVGNAGLSGRVLCSEAGGPAADIYDLSESEESFCAANPTAPSRFCLMGFINASDADRWAGATAEQRRDALLQQYAGLFPTGSGTSLKELCTGYIEKSWAEEEWVGGAFFASPRAGILSSYGRLWCGALGEGRIHFASTEAAESWSGYMEGAVQIGEKRGAEVARYLLSGHEPPQDSPDAESPPVPAGWPNSVGRLGDPKLPTPWSFLLWTGGSVCALCVALLWNTCCHTTHLVAKP